MVERGVTLIELVLVLFIMGIISMLTVMSYQHYVHNSRLAEAKVVLLALVDRLDQYSLMADISNFDRVEAIVAPYQSAYYAFVAETVLDEETGRPFWRVQALPTSKMRGRGSLGLDSRGYSCYVADSDDGCAPHVRERWQ